MGIANLGQSNTTYKPKGGKIPFLGLSEDQKKKYEESSSKIVTPAPDINSAVSEVTKVAPPKKTKVGSFIENLSEQELPKKFLSIKNKVNDTVKDLLDKTVNTPQGKEIIMKVSEGTRDLPIKARAVSELAYGELLGSIAPNVFGKVKGRSYNEILKGIEEEYQSKPAAQFARELSSTTLQTLIGVVANFVPLVGKPLSTAYYGALSASEQIEKRGEVYSPVNIAIDTIGDRLLGSSIERILSAGPTKLMSAMFGKAAPAVQGGLIEGLTEPSQTLLKYANDYINAKPETRDGIVDEAMSYVKDGGLLKEFLISALSGGMISGPLGFIGVSDADGKAINVPKPKTGSAPAEEGPLPEPIQKIKDLTKVAPIEQVAAEVAKEFDISTENATEVALAASAIVREEKKNIDPTAIFDKVSTETDAIGTANKDIDSILGVAEEPFVVDEEARDIDREDILSELEDVSEELQDTAEKDWDENVAPVIEEANTKASEEVAKLNEELKVAKDKTEKKAIQEKIKKIESELDEKVSKAENEFLDKYSLENRQKEGKVKKKKESQIRTVIKEAPEEGEKETTTARGYAKDLIKNEVLRGDTIQDLRKGQQAQVGGKISAGIGGFVDGRKVSTDKIVVKVGDNEPEIFSLKEIFNEIKAESTEKESAVLPKQKKRAKVIGDERETNNIQSTGGRPDIGDSSESLRDLEDGSEVGRGAGPVGSEGVARGEDQPGDFSVREGSRTPVTNEDIQAILENKTSIAEDGEVLLNAFLTDEEEQAVREYQPSGGREKKGAKGRGLLDEYFTDDRVTNLVKSALANLGIFTNKDISVLEPSVGMGAFLDVLPINNEVTGYEINETTARITKALYPGTEIYNRPFEDIFIDSRGNVKDFESEAVYDLVIGNPPYGEHRGKYKGLGEEPTIEKYEEYFIKRSLDLTVKGGYVAMVVPSSILRNGPSKAKELISSLGVLKEAWRLPNGAFSTTGIGTDILIFAKDPTTDASVIEERKTNISEDKYFTDSPEHILGEQYKAKGKFGEEMKVRGTLEEAVTKFENIQGENIAKDLSDISPELETSDDIGEIAEGTEELYKPEEAVEIAEEVEASIEEVENIEEVPTTVLEQRKETYKDKKKVEKELKERNVEAPVVDERVTISTKKETKSTLNLSSFSTAKPEDKISWEKTTATGELSDLAGVTNFFFYKGAVYNEFNYLQGNIYEKLDQLEQDHYLMTNDQYAKQKKALKAILPEPYTIERISISPNARFVHDLKLSGDKSLASRFLLWLKELPRQSFGESSLYDVRDYVDSLPVRGRSKEENAKARRTRRIEADRLFKLFLKDELNDDERSMVEEKYNRLYNAYYRPDYRNVPLISNLHDTFYNDKLDIRDVQFQGIGFLVNKGVGLLAHDVGVGKTMQGIVAINETMARGWSKKPLIVVPNINVYKQWINEIQELIPDAKINLLANLGGDFKGDIKNLKIEDGTISIVTYEGFKRLGFKDETYNELTSDFGDAIARPMDTARGDELESARIEELAAKGIKGTEAELSFEDLGFDLLEFDEVHNANHIIGSVKVDKEENKGVSSEYRGLNQRPSELGIKTWLAAQYIQKKNNGRNVYLLSATPFTNNPLEYYSILSLMARNRLKQMGLFNANDFINLFMELSVKYEFKANGKYEEKTDVRGFKNYQQFSKLLTEFIDFRDGEEAGVVRPNRQEKKIYVKPTEEQREYFVEAQELFKKTDEAGALQAISEFKQAAFSPYASRYYLGKKPTAKQFVENSPKIKMAMEMIKQNRKDRPDAGQLVYSTIGSEYFPLMKEYLIKNVGFKPHEVDIISGSTPKHKRSTIQDNFNQKIVKVILGSDAIKEGVNLQKNTSDVYLLTLPWNFTQLRQVIGRGWRHGNRWKNIRINTLFTENSVDIFLSQKLENKSRRYEEGLKFRGDFLDTSDVDFEEVKFDLVTDPALKFDLERTAKISEMDSEIRRVESETAYLGRRAKDLIELNQRLSTYKKYLEEYQLEKNEYMTDYYSGQVEKITSERADAVRLYKDKGIDVENIEAQTIEGEKKVKEMKDALDLYKLESAKKLEQLKNEPAPEEEVGETDFRGVLNSLALENRDFFIPRDQVAFQVKAEVNPEVTLKTLKKLEGREFVSSQFISDLSNASDLKQQERELIREVLLSYEGRDVPVQEFIDQVEALVLPVTRVGYGQETAKGVVMGHTTGYESISLNPDLRGPVKNYQEIIYETPTIETSGGQYHFGRATDNYFGHVRIEDMADDVTRRVIEVQSDLYQRGRLDSEANIQKNRVISKGGKAKDINEVDKNISKLQQYNDPTAHFRMVREEIKQAAKDRKTTILFPTGETAMKIEGLGGQGQFWFDEESGEPLLPQDLVVGKIITQGNGDPNGFAGYEEWVITDVLENGKFKALSKEKWDNIDLGVFLYSAEEKRLTELWNKNQTTLTPSEKEEVDALFKKATQFKESFQFNREIPDTETFDISGKMDKENPIYKFYDKTLRRYLVSNYQANEKVDEQGVSWIEVPITNDMATAPIFAFNERNVFTEHRPHEISAFEGVKRLEWYKKRFKLDFDVQLADIIYTHEISKRTGEKIQAYGVNFDDTIAFSKWITETTADHEMVHFVVANMKKIEAFKGFSRSELLRELNNDKDFSPEESILLEEELAIGYERYVKERKGFFGKVRAFFEKLSIELEKVFTSLKGKHGVVRKFYQELYFGKGSDPIRINNQRLMSRITGERDNKRIIDFARYRGDVITSFQKMFEGEPFVEEFKLRDLRRKDINDFLVYTATAHDIYVEDNTEFVAAKHAEDIENRRRMQKEVLDLKYTALLKPFYDLNKASRSKVVEVLLKGDDQRTVFAHSQLEAFGLDKKEIEAYFGVRQAFDTAFEQLITEMRNRGVDENEIMTYRNIQAGYMPHKWDGRYVIKTQEIAENGQWRTTYMEAYKSKRLQEKALAELKASGGNKRESIRFIADTLDQLEVDFFSEQRFSFENMKSIIEQAKTPSEVKSKMIDAVREAIKEKGFGRHFITRTGVRGFDTDNMPKYIADYFTGFTGFITKMEAAQKHFYNLATVDARRQKNFYAWLRDYIAFNMGSTADLNLMKSLAFIYYLANDISFLFLNMTQNMVIGTAELSKLYTGAGKILGAEASLIKATMDWVRKGITTEEKEVIEGLLKMGRLGGEMASELLGFKNNPVYRAYSKGLNHALYTTTSLVETHINRVPAFLAARRRLIAKGMDATDANNKALEISDNIHFRYGKPHRPAFMRNKVSNLYFTFTTYTRSWLYLLYQNIKHKEFMAVGKSLFYAFLLGGTAGLPFAKLIKMIIEEVTKENADDDDKEELSKWQIALNKGAPAAFLNVDISNQIGIGIMQLENIFQTFTSDEVPLKQFIRLLGGAFGGIMVRAGEGVDLLTQGRMDEAFGRLLPDFLGNIAKAYHGTVYGVHSFPGNPLVDPITGDDFYYTTTEGITKALGFTPARESIAWDAKSKEWKAKEEADQAREPYREKIRALTERGQIEEARAIQDEAREAGVIADTTDYIRPLVRDSAFKTALADWNQQEKSQEKLTQIHREVARELYGENASQQQITSVAKEFGFYRYFGFDNSWANKIREVSSNAEKVEILNEARTALGPDEFRELFETGRKTVTYESGRKGYILISDELREMYLKQND